MTATGLSFARRNSIVLVTLLTVVGCTTPHTLEPESLRSPFKPIASIQEIMDAQIDPGADQIWDSVEFVATLDGVEDRRPRTNADWLAIRRAAITLIEAANLLTIEGRRIVAQGGAAEGDRPPQEMQRQVDATWPQFVQFASLLRIASLQTLTAIDARDTKALLEAGGALDRACEACHATYWYPTKSPPPHELP